MLQEQLSSRTATLLFRESLSRVRIDAEAQRVGPFLFATFPAKYSPFAHLKFPSSQHKIASNLLGMFSHYGETMLTFTAHAVILKTSKYLSAWIFQGRKDFAVTTYLEPKKEFLGILRILSLLCVFHVPSSTGSHECQIAEYKIVNSAPPPRWVSKESASVLSNGTPVKLLRCFSLTLLSSDVTFSCVSSCPLIWKWHLCRLNEKKILFYL